MNNKHIYIMDNQKPVNITSYGNNGHLKLVNANNADIISNNSIEKHLLLRLHNMELNNAQLEKLVEDRTIKLNDVVETNAKFLSILAHDLRSPFQSIIISLDLLQDGLNEYEVTEIETYINIAVNSANSTLRLLDNLLSWTSSQNIEKNFIPVKVNLHEVISYEVESVRTLATQKLITLNNFISPDLNVSADLKMVETILRNLINNAVKYSYLGGEITINAIENREFVEIDIKDNGVGISLSAQRDLFQPNEFHSTRGTRNEHGTGLGLLLCKEFVERHGGIIWIESEPCKGSKIKFTLPHYF
jgi:signal transduction histidine kinase